MHGMGTMVNRTQIWVTREGCKVSKELKSKSAHYTASSVKFHSVYHVWCNIKLKFQKSEQ